MSETAFPSSPSPGGGSDWQLNSVGRLIWGRRWVVLLVAAEVFVVTGLVTFLRTPLYEASARVQIERSTPKVTQAEDINAPVWNEFEIQRFYQTQYLLLRDPAVLRAALDRYEVRKALTETLAPSEERTDETTLPNDDALASYVRGALRVEQLEYSNVVSVSFRHPSPAVAAAVINAVVDSYREFFVRNALSSRLDAKSFLSDQVAGAQAEVKQLEQELAEMRGSLESVIPATGAEVGKSRLESVDATLTQSKMARAQAETRVAALERSKPSSLPEVRGNPQVIRYQEHLAGLRRELAELEGKVGPAWPRLKELRSAAAETEATLEREMTRVHGAALQEARIALERANREVGKLDALLRDELRDTATQQRSAVDYHRKNDEYLQKKTSLDQLLAREQELKIGANLEEILRQQVSVIDQAKPPKVPAVPNVRVNLVLGLVFGLFLGVAAAFLADALDNKVRGAAQLQELTRLPLLGAIPRVAGKERPRLVFSRDRSAGRGKGPSPVMAAQQHDAEEAFRALRSALLLAKAGSPARSLMVTSALPGEGKSTVSANIGRTLAMFGHKTALIDADLRHPRLHRVFKLSPGVGLTNLLVGSAEIEQVIQPTRYPGLALIAGGPCPPDPATLLDEKRIAALVTQLHDRHGFEFVIIDTPPTLVFADAFNIVRSVEGVVLVARALVTPKDAIRQAADALRKLGAPLLGTVLNGEVSEDHSGSYYRYYHYRYGYYQKRAQREADALSDSPLDTGTPPDRRTATVDERSEVS